VSWTLQQILLVTACLTTLAAADVAAAAEQSPANKSVTASTSETEELQEVTVTAQHLKLDWAQRNELVQKAIRFVFGIAPAESYEAFPPRWFAPVCPQVTGLSREQGEFVLVRISEIARAAGARLAGEECHPNLLIFVTTKPKPLLRAMFGNATPYKVDAFIDTPRPVRVWYSAYKAPAGAMEIAGSRNSKFVEGFGLVYVFVDRTQLNDVSQKQLADYMAMVSLAEIKSPAHFGDTPTILRLFDGLPQAAPEGLSDWDREFLKILYHPQPSLANPRANTARRMVVELIP
jgi:hypothetical protein